MKLTIEKEMLLFRESFGINFIFNFLQNLNWRTWQKKNF